jgi:hypothetical protein
MGEHPPERIEVGRCYLTTTERGYRLRRMVRVMPGGRVQYERRAAAGTRATTVWVLCMTDRRAFARTAEREVPCDWTPESEG